MRKQLVNVLGRVCLLVLISVVFAGVSAMGQAFPSRLRVNIPFDFTVGDRQLPSGTYSFNRAQPTNRDLVLQVKRLDGDFNTFSVTVPVLSLETQNKGSIVFHRYGDQYFLYQLWPAGENTGRAFTKSQGERQLEKKFHNIVNMVDKNRKTVEIVTLAAESR